MRISKIQLAVTALALTALACGMSLPGVDAPSGNPADSPAPTPFVPGGGSGDSGSGPASSDRPLFQDDFKGRDSTWGTGTDTDSSVEYVNDALQMLVFTPNYFVYSRPSDREYSNIHIEVTVVDASADPNAAFGIMCHQQFIDDSFYYAYITPSGDYGIVKAALARDDVDLITGSSEAIPQNASSYRIGLDCGNGTLILYVNGERIDSISDPDYTSGKVALFAWSDEAASGVNVTFDDIVITALP